MVTLPALWLPILLSAVAVFIASSVIHMALRYHNTDFRPMPDEAAARQAIGGLHLPPGDYVVPHCATVKEMSGEAHLAKRREGPVLLMTVLPNGIGNMTPQLLQWFVYLLVVGVFVAYVTRLGLPAGTEYLKVHRVAGAAAFMAHGLGSVPQSVWFRRDWRTTFKNLVDAVVYGLVTGGVFGWLWP